MKGQNTVAQQLEGTELLTRLTRPFQLGRKDLWLTCAPALLWLTAIHLRDSLIHPRCGASPQLCNPDTLPAMDRMVYALDLPGADGYSFTTQNLSAVLAILAPLAWNIARSIRQRSGARTFLSRTLEDLLIFLQFTVWNGLMTELVRISAQRARPFVYKNPLGEGGEPSHYVSFYSGHTSFAAAAATGTLLILLSRRAPLPALLAALAAGQVLTFLTGIFRVLAGRHFITDVVAAIVAGSLVTFLLLYLHPRKSES